MKKKKCECRDKATASNMNLYSPEEYSGMNHEAGECKGTNDIKPYRRGNEILYLCSCCNLWGDIPIGVSKKKTKVKKDVTG